MAHGNHDDERDLPMVWPFTFAGLCLLGALVWFCLGFAIEDRKLPEPAVTEGPVELAGHYTVFWILIAVGGASVLGGIAMNMARDHRRRNR